jgi:hypothetical protein
MTHNTDPRYIKRMQGLTAPGYRVYEAYQLGEYASYEPHSLSPRLRRNPYPKGKRHDEWQRGYITGGRSL